MNAVKFPKNWKVYLCFAAAAIALFFTYPEKGDFTYRYHRGSPWIYDNLVAPFSFPILKTPQELSDEMEAKSNEVIDYYLYDEGVCEEEINAFTAHIHRDSVADSIYANAVPVVISTLDEIYNRGVVSDFNDDKKDGIIFIKRGKRVKEVPAAEAYSLQEARKEMISAISAIEGLSNPDSVAIVLNLKSFIVPNMTFDAATTAQVHKEAIDYISPTKGTFYSGQLIVSNGEIVTAELEQILDSFKAEYNASYGYYGSDLEAIAYKLMIVVLIIILFFFALLFANSEILNQTNSYLFFLTLFAILFITISVVNDHFSSYILAIPFSVYLLYSMAFFPAAVVFPSYAVALLPLLVIPENGTLLFFMNLFAGGALLLSYNRFHRGWTQFINCIVVFIAIFAVYMTFTLMGNRGLIKTDLIHLGIHSVLILALYPVVFLLERIFSFISDVRLWELSDTNNLLLQELARKAPGTFQHSLQVASMAEDACRKLGGNPTLIRTGALYHDIGKINNPHCFIENERSGDTSYHHDLSYKESAKEIIRHMEEGCQIAKKYHLPDAVINMIRSHHGTTQTGYFYTKYLNEGGDPDAADDFTYNGILPSTKEEAILMLADGVEAASRSMKELTDESISKLVEGIVAKRMADGQLAKADLTFKEIDLMKSLFKDYLAQVHHHRIAYPKKNV